MTVSIGALSSDPLVSATAAVVVALLFAQALLHKLVQRASFVQVLAAYRLLPGRLLAAGWALLVLAEASVVGTVLWFPTRTVGLRLAAALLLLYAGAMAINLWRGRRDLDCGCGAQVQPLRAGLVIRNLLLAAGAWLAGAPVQPRPLETLDLFAIGAAGIGLWALLQVADELMRQGARLASLNRPIP